MSSDKALTITALALALSRQDWMQLGLVHDDPVTTSKNLSLKTAIDRVAALLTIRVVAVVSSNTFPDFSTTTICQQLLLKPEKWLLDDSIIDSIHNFCERMLSMYKDVPYHNYRHAYHVVLSANKLLDMMILQRNESSGSSSHNHKHQSNKQAKKKLAKTFGLRYDPMSLFALIFSALIHDVEHQGIPNRQLAIEDDRLAVLYNDHSIAENWSLYNAFSEFLQDEFKPLRLLLFPPKQDDSNTSNGISSNNNNNSNSVEDPYRRFRKCVVNLVLNTDIASPERTQISKSKWKEAFGDVERRMRRKESLTGANVNIYKNSSQQRRATNESHYSEISVDNTDNNDESPPLTPEPSFHGENDDDDDAGDEDSDTLLARSGHANAASTDKQDRRMSGQTTSSRQTTQTTQSARYRYRLGILRTVDLSGETLETYSRRMSLGFTSMHGNDDNSNNNSNGTDQQQQQHYNDEPNELKATVVLECIITAADVAHNLQSWQHMCEWSNNLYYELRKAYHDKRGFDPQYRWFENQIGFLESYLLPLAMRLEGTGVFGEELGSQFRKWVEDNRDKWLMQGYDVAQATIEEGAKMYPVSEDHDQ